MAWFTSKKYGEVAKVFILYWRFSFVSSTLEDLIFSLFELVHKLILNLFIKLKYIFFT